MEVHHRQLGGLSGQSGMGGVSGMEYQLHEIKRREEELAEMQYDMELMMQVKEMELMGRGHHMDHMGDLQLEMEMVQREMDMLQMQRAMDRGYQGSPMDGWCHTQGHHRLHSGMQGRQHDSRMSMYN